MKIEKISETQIKFILSKSDLEGHNIQINELAYGSEKTHRLFQEMMRQANTECDFHSENTPLMVEAMPMGANQVVIVVTKIANGAEGFNPLHLLNARVNNNSACQEYKTQEIEEPEVYGVEDLTIFSFTSLDDVVSAAKRLLDIFMGQSRLYKSEGRYYLVIQEDFDYALAEIEIALHEYGTKHISLAISENYLIEHGELMVGQQAVEKLARYL